MLSIGEYWNASTRFVKKTKKRVIGESIARVEVLFRFQVTHTGVGRDTNTSVGQSYMLALCASRENHTHPDSDRENRTLPCFHCPLRDAFTYSRDVRQQTAAARRASEEAPPVRTFERAAVMFVMTFWMCGGKRNVWRINVEETCIEEMAGQSCTLVEEESNRGGQGVHVTYGLIIGPEHQI